MFPNSALISLSTYRRILHCCEKHDEWYVSNGITSQQSVCDGYGFLISLLGTKESLLGGAYLAAGALYQLTGVVALEPAALKSCCWVLICWDSSTLIPSSTSILFNIHIHVFKENHLHTSGYFCENMPLSIFVSCESLNGDNDFPPDVNMWECNIWLAHPSS